MFYVIIADGAKDDDVALRGPFKSVKLAKDAMVSEAGDLGGPLGFTVIKPLANGTVEIISTGTGAIDWRS